MTRTIPRWAAPACVGVAVAGFATSAYLTVAHYASPSILACSARGLVNCERVTTSAQSKLLGVPVAVLGLAWFLAMGMATSPPAWRSVNPAVRAARLALAVAGMGFVVYLVYAELFVIGAICLWCTVAHALAFALFVLVMAFGASVTPERAPSTTPLRA